MPPSKALLTDLLKPDTKIYKLRCLVDKDRASEALKLIDYLEPSDSAQSKAFLNYVITKSRKGVMRNEYSTSRENGSKGWGRLSADKGKSYVTLTRKARHYLAMNFYTDIDIQNCHPVLIEQLCDLYGLTAERDLLRHWAENRETIFKTMQQKSTGLYDTENKTKIAETINRDNCKRMAFVFLYEGSVTKMQAELGLQDTEDPEIKRIIDIARSLKLACLKLRNLLKLDFPNVWANLPFNVQKGRPDAGKFSALMQHLERAIMLAAAEVVTTEGYEIGDYCHDGLFICKDDEPVNAEALPSLFGRIEACVAYKTGFQIKMTHKEMSLSPEFMPSEGDWIDEPFWGLASAEKTTDRDMATWYADNHDNIRVCGGALYKASQDCIWSQHKDVRSSLTNTIYEAMEKEANRIKAKIPIYDVKARERLDNFVKDYGSQKTTEGVVRWLMGIITDENLMEKLGTPKGWVSIEDGLFNLETGELRPRRMDDYCTYKINRKYLGDDCRGEFHDAILHMMCGNEEVYRFLQQVFGYALSGEKNIDLCMILIGAGGNGKSLLLSLISQCLGGHLITTIDGDDVSKNGSAGRAAQTYARLQGRRFLVCPETDQGLPIRGDIIKKTSSVDTVSCKLLYQDPFEITPSVIPIIGCDNHPNLQFSAPILRRVCYVEFNQTYVDPEGYKQKQEWGFDMNRVHVKDDTLKERISMDEVFSWVVQGARAYYAQSKKLPRPAAVVKATEENLLEGSQLCGWITAKFDLKVRTGDDLVFWKRTDLAKEYVSEFKTGSVRSVATELKQFFQAIGFSENIKDGYKGYRLCQVT